jgi:hypothetical protein
MNPIQRRARFHFTDRTTLTVEWPKQDATGHLFLSEAIRKAIEARQLLVEADGKLLVIQMSNVKYVELLPAPEPLPEGVIRNARLVAEEAATLSNPQP